MRPTRRAPRTPTRLADGLGAEGCPVASRGTRLAPKGGSPALPAFRETRRSCSVPTQGAFSKTRYLDFVKGSPRARAPPGRLFIRPVLGLARVAAVERPAEQLVLDDVDRRGDLLLVHRVQLG